MIIRVATLVLALLLPFAAAAETLRHDGRERGYILDVPPGLDLPAPTVFVLHGGSRSAEKIRRSTRFHETGALKGFVTVYPDGHGNQWNDAREASAVRGNQGGEDIDDVGFLTALARKLVADGTADPARIFVTGSSNGGMMSFRLLCEAAGVFAAFAPVIASLPEKAEHSCKPARPAPLLMINGTEDRLIPWDGGLVAPMFPGDRGRVLPVERTLAIFRNLYGCSQPRDSATLDPGDYVIPLHIAWHRGCSGGSEIGLYRFDGMGHRWPQAARRWIGGRWDDILGPAPEGFPAAEHIWAFFERHSLPK